MPRGLLLSPEGLEEAFGRGPGPVRQVFAPYRLSPLGAHTDHQLGLTSGFTLDCGLSLVFRPAAGPRVRLCSRDFAGVVEFDLQSIPAPDGGWGDYARGVSGELVAAGGLQRGLDGMMAGDLPPGGISSSAALQVAVLLALLDANQLALDRLRAMKQVVAAERHYAGVSVGLLDPAVILHGREESLVVLDCLDEKVRVHRFSRRLPPREWILVDSGLPRDLRSSPYNQRVEECRAAARALGAPPEDPRLRHVSPESFRRQRRNLDPVLRRRAEHFFAEHKRVKLGAGALATGDLEALGQLINASAESLTHLFECGTPETRALLLLLREAEGVLGASYAGGGFGGLLHVLAQPGTEATLGPSVLERYRRSFPECADRAWVRAVGSGPGAHVC